MAQRGYRTIQVTLGAGEIVPVYASARVADPLGEIMADMPLYDGVQLMKVLEAFYAQGKKDGARVVYDDLDKRVLESKKSIKHKNPGRPRRRRT